MGYGKGKLWDYFAEKLLLMHEYEFAKFLSKEERYEKSMFHYIGFGPWGDTSILPVPMLKSTLPHIGITTQHCPISR
jgi:hypothetical protein